MKIAVKVNTNSQKQRVFMKEGQLYVYFRGVREDGKANEKLVVKGAIQDGKFIDAAQVKVLASLPGRPQLLSMLASALQGPIRKLAVAVKAVADKPQAAA